MTDNQNTFENSDGVSVGPSDTTHTVLKDIRQSDLMRLTDPTYGSGSRNGMSWDLSEMMMQKKDSIVWNEETELITIVSGGAIGMEITPSKEEFALLIKQGFIKIK